MPIRPFGRDLFLDTRYGRTGRRHGPLIRAIFARRLILPMKWA
jgi:hypothetical protein